MLETDLRQHRCCFTDHRPEKLNRSEAEIVIDLKKEIQAAIADGFQTFISGMARGVDIWAAEIVLALRDNGSEIQLICASPYKGFEKLWSSEWQDRYQRILSEADKICFIGSCYNRKCFQRRNEWMVDHSVRVIAVYNGQTGGTKNTVSYANVKGVPVQYLRA